MVTYAEALEAASKAVFEEKSIGEYWICHLDHYFYHNIRKVLKETSNRDEFYKLESMLLELSKHRVKKISRLLDSAELQTNLTSEEAKLALTLQEAYSTFFESIRPNFTRKD